MIFGRFPRAARRATGAAGTGLACAMSQIIDLHGGRITRRAKAFQQGHRLHRGFRARRNKWLVASGQRQRSRTKRVQPDRQQRLAIT
jgi:hypothetical protein